MALKRPKNSAPQKSNIIRTLFFWASLALIALFLVSVFVKPSNIAEKSITDIIARANKGDIQKLIIQDRTAYVVAKGENNP